jgi:hypothetical protein
MTTSRINRRHHPLYAAAVTALVGTLLTIPLNGAYAMPGHDDQPTVSRSVRSHGHYVGHACFIKPQTWNEALAGPLPGCYAYLP